MSRTVQYSEPSNARAGNTWEWKKTLSEFPATAWTLSYTLYNASAVISITASADGSDHSVDVAGTTTADYTAGWYDWIAQVTDGTDIYQVGKGRINVLPDLSSSSSYDGRTHARKMLDYINSILEGRASAETIDAVSADLNGLNISYNLPNLLTLRDRYATAVKAEDDALALSNGDQSGRFIRTRFVA